jgi:hypothetical protein
MDDGAFLNANRVAGDKLLAILAEQKDIDQADRLAALAYKNARYDLAANFAARSEAPRAYWIRAKLAAQKGDLAGAAENYAAALRHPDAGQMLDLENQGLLRAETGLLSLARGDFLAAMEFFWAAGEWYWRDTAFLAERVLTADELKAFVAARKDESLASRDLRKQLADSIDKRAGAGADPSKSMEIRIRDLLARRLMREGRFEEAMPYFRSEEIRAMAASYAGLRREATRRWTDIGKSEALFLAALLARRWGMEMMGTEGAPDFFTSEGFLGCCGGFVSQPGARDRDDVMAPAVFPQEGAGPGEHERFLASAPKPERRFHYRYAAAQLASDAADLLPARSQAFAATLCQASQWMKQSAHFDEAAREVERRLYARYVRDGAFVSFGSFTEPCPEPDFEAAKGTWLRLLTIRTRLFLLDHRWAVLAAGVAILGGLVMVLRRDRRRA